MRSAASKAELEWMQANPERATKVYKSGAREFGGDENQLALLKVRQEAIKPFIVDKAKNIRKNRGRALKAGAAVGVAAGIPYYFLTNNTGPTATVLDLIGNNTRKNDGTPRFTHTYTYDDFNSDQKAFLQDAIDKKQTQYWSTPEERAAYFEKHPNDTIRTGWYGRVAGTNIKQSDYKKYYGKDYGGLTAMPKLTGFGIGVGMKNPVEAGMYETMQTLGSFPISYTKDHAIIEDTWDFNKADHNKKYVKSYNPLDILTNLRIFAGKHGTSEADNYVPIVTTHAEVPYRKINKNR